MNIPLISISYEYSRILHRFSFLLGSVYVLSHLILQPGSMDDQKNMELPNNRDWGKLLLPGILYSVIIPPVITGCPL